MPHDERKARQARIREGWTAGLGFACADWLAAGTPSAPAALPLLILGAGLAGGTVAGVVGTVLGRRGVAYGLVLAGAMALELASRASKELALAANAPALAVALALAVTTGVVGGRWLDSAERPGARAFLPLAAIPGAALVADGLPAGVVGFVASAALPLAVVIMVYATRARVRGAAFVALAAALALATPAALAGRQPERSALSPVEATAAEGAPDVVLLVVDTLRADALEGAHFEELASAGVRFEHALSAAPWTLPSVASILTALYPSQHGAVSAARPLTGDATTLAEVLRREGWQTAAFTGGAFVSSALRLDQGFEVFDAEEEFGFTPFRVYVPLVWRVVKNRFAPQRWILRSIDEYEGLEGVVEAAGDWLREGRDPSRPLFLFLHTYEVHDYYLYHAVTDDSAREREDALSERFRGRLSIHPSELTAATQTDLDWMRDVYDARVSSVDRSLGDLLALLGAGRGGARERPLIVALTSDHGEGFDAARGRVHHGGRLHDDLLRVPLILRAPGRLKEGQVVSEPVRTVDLMPTLLELAGVAAPPGLAGVSLLPALNGEGPWPGEAWSEERANGKSLLALHKDGWKLVASPDGVEAYELARDPAEDTPGSDAPPELEARLEEFAREFPPREVREEELDPATLEHLRALGYIR